MSEPIQSAAFIVEAIWHAWLDQDIDRAIAWLKSDRKAHIARGRAEQKAEDDKSIEVLRALFVRYVSYAQHGFPFNEDNEVEILHEYEKITGRDFPQDRKAFREALALRNRG